MRYRVARYLAHLGRGPFAVLQVTWDATNDWVAAANRRREARERAATREGR